MRSRKSNSVKIQKGMSKLTRKSRNFRKMNFKLTLDKKGHLQVLQHADTPVYDAPVPMPSIKPEKEELHGEQGN